MSDKLKELAERCERAEGADRELDRLIVLATQDVERIKGPAADGSQDGFVDAKGVLKPHGFAYTASLDAARTLIPEEWLVVSLSEIAGDGMAFCELGNPFRSLEAIGIAREMELALTAACLCALRARGSADHAPDGEGAV